MLEVTKFFLNDKPLPLYLSEVPQSLRSLQSEDYFYFKLSDLCDFYGLDLPKLDLYDAGSVRKFSNFVSSYFSHYHLSFNQPGIEQGDMFLGWRAFFSLDDLCPETTQKEFLWMGIKIEDFIMNYLGCVRQALKNKNLISTVTQSDVDGNEFKEERLMVTGISLAALHRITIAESLKDSLEKPFGFGISARDYQSNKSDYLTESDLSTAMSKLLRQKISKKKLVEMLIANNLLEVDPKYKAKRHRLTEIGKNYAIDRPRTWHRSVIQLIENNGVD